ncbi:uncharacterized protein LOC122154044 [Tyto alba]|uniref:uncharacterized protein LOC122154044 n=1 Tax=Tyto alba TaxID=56313 RepID=UPI001C6755E1|nr:uncharacterized protein LOC122154044 [Tyto alba]
MRLPGHREIFCSCSIKAICVSLPAVRDPARGRKSMATQEAEAQDGDSMQMEVSSPPRGPWAVPCFFLLLPCPAPAPGRATYQPALAGPQSPAQPPISVPSSQSRAQFTGEAGATARMCFISGQLTRDDSCQPPQFWAGSDLFTGGELPVGPEPAWGGTGEAVGKQGCGLLPQSLQSPRHRARPSTVQPPWALAWLGPGRQEKVGPLRASGSGQGGDQTQGSHREQGRGLSIVFHGAEAERGVAAGAQAAPAPVPAAVVPLRGLSAPRDRLRSQPGCPLPLFLPARPVLAGSLLPREDQSCGEPCSEHAQ